MTTSSSSSSAEESTKQKKKQAEAEVNKRYQKDEFYKNQLSRYESIMRQIIAEGREARTKRLFESWIETYSKLPENNGSPVDELKKRLQSMGLACDVDRILASDPEAPIGQKKQLQKIEREIVKNEGEAIKPSQELSDMIADLFSDAYASKTRLEEKAEKIKQKANEEGIPKEMLADMMRDTLKKIGLDKDQIYYRIKLLGLTNRKSSIISGQNVPENSIEDEQDERSEARIEDEEVTKSAHLYADKEADPEVEAALEEKPVKDRMHYESEIKSLQLQVEAFSSGKKHLEERMQQLQQENDEYVDAMKKEAFHEAKPVSGTIRMKANDWNDVIQWAALARKEVEIEHDGLRVIKVVKITGSERR